MRAHTYRRECPHHGFDNEYLLGVFYDGVTLEAQNQLDSSSNEDFMTQTTEGDFALIENKVASSANKNAETDRSMKVSSVGTSRMDELSAKMDQLIMSNQNPVFIMEDSLLEQSIKDVVLDTDKPIEDQQNVSYINGQGWQFNNYHPNPNVTNNLHLFGHNTRTDNPDKAQNIGYQKSYPQNVSGRSFVLSNSGNQSQNFKPQNNPQIAPIVATAPQD